MRAFLGAALAGLVTGLFGDLFLGSWRVWVTLLVALGATAAVYVSLAPVSLPLWPGFIALVVAGFAGLVWERHAKL